MSQFRPKSLKMLLSFALAAVLVIVLTLTVVAQQDPEDVESGNPPDKVTLVEEEEFAESNRADHKHVFVSANAFVPWDDNMDYEYFNGGCIYRKAGSGYSVYSLQLPDGAEIKFIRLFFYDNDTVYNPRVYLYSYDGAGTYTIIKEVSTTGTPGWSSAGSGIFSYEVDNYNESLALVLYYGFGADPINVKICGVRVQYKYNALFGSFFPLIEK